MSILTQRLPREIDGVPIYADFRNMIEFDTALNKEDITTDEAIRLGLWLLFENIPKWGADKLTKELIGFYLRGGGENKGKKTARGLDFVQDADIIYSMFRQEYNINLNEIKFLHWFEFMAMLESLPSECRLMQIIYYRTCDTAKMSHNERKRVLEMRRVYEIKATKDDSIESKRERVKAILARGD